MRVFAISLLFFELDGGEKRGRSTLLSHKSRCDSSAFYSPGETTIACLASWCKMPSI